MYVYSPSTDWLGPAQTDREGNFAFTNLPHGSYRLAVYRGREREAAREETVEVPHGHLSIVLP